MPMVPYSSLARLAWWVIRLIPTVWRICQLNPAMAAPRTKLRIGTDLGVTIRKARVNMPTLTTADGRAANTVPPDPRLRMEPSDVTAVPGGGDPGYDPLTTRGGS